VIKLEFNRVEAIKQCVIAGLGFAFLPEIAVQEQISQGKLKPLHWERSFRVCTLMIWHKGKWKAPVLDKFLNVCRQMKSL
jgi:DNA-binding transcriptional LysR family regulator